MLYPRIHGTVEIWGCNNNHPSLKIVYMTYKFMVILGMVHGIVLLALLGVVNNYGFFFTFLDLDDLGPVVSTWGCLKIGYSPK